jgi:hypothetical protein
MEFAEFEEKQFEIALITELAAGQPTAYPSGQVLEALVGYDVALHPGDPKIWDLLEVGFPPGIVLSPGLWSRSPNRPPTADLPQDLVSLILQVKRPCLLNHFRAGQHHYWRGPYYRFQIEGDQQGQLAALEAGAAGRALVRYASAAFLTMGVLYEHQRERVIAEHSSFVAPSTLSGHRLWTYARPGTTGYANPDQGLEAPSDTRETLFARAAESITHESIATHVQELATSAGADMEPAAWIDELFPPDAVTTSDRRHAIRAWASIAQAVERAGASWFVLNLTL